MMLSRFRPRLTYANVVSSIALFAVLTGGVAWAHGKIGTSDIRKGAVTTPKLAGQAVKAGKLGNNSVRPRKIRNGAVNTNKLRDESVIGSKLSDGAVSTDKLGDESVSTSKLAPEAVEHGKIGDGAVSLQKLSTGAIDSFVARADILYASVNGTGGLQANNSRGATSATQTGTGAYTVTFNRDVSGCAWFPSRSAIGTAIPANGDFLGVGGQTGQPANVRVRIRDQNNNLANRSFSLLVAC